MVLTADSGHVDITVIYGCEDPATDPADCVAGNGANNHWLDLATG